MSDGGARLRRIRELFDAALEHPPAGRDAYLAALTDGDAALADDVRALLAGEGATDPRLAAAVPPLDGPDAAPDLAGERLGPYEVVRLVGLGGMGAVYEAVRVDDQFRKRVAIKLVHRGLRSALTLARFRQERQILASLQHKNIATLLDGGVAPDGRPFLVMEFVEGEPITAWCDRRRLPIRERVALFRQVCDAVRHAHQNLVIHRDLKPGNILVTADGSVKLLDFGVAKLLGDESAEPDLPLTRGGARPFTPEYASPEQIRGEPLTTASDEYSLGVVLFELLAGRRPHEVPGGLAALERAVLEQPVPRPSAVATDDAARARGESGATRLRSRLSGELDSLVLTALRPEPGRRYASVEALGDDARRWLAGLPLEAQRHVGGYAIGKFVRRNRLPLAAGALVTCALVAGVIGTSLEAKRARAAQTRAERVNGFLRTVLESVRPETGGRDVPVSELLDAAAKRIEVDLADQPDVRAELENVIGESYQSLGKPEKAIEHLRTGVRLRREVDGPRSSAYALALNNLAYSHLEAGELPAADSLFHRALAVRRSAGGAPDTTLATILDNLGSLEREQGHLAPSESLRIEALALRRRLLGDHHDSVARTLNNLAVLYGQEGRWATAESLHRQVLAIARANHPGVTVSVANAENALATALDIQGRAAPAESLYRDAMRLRARLLGTDHPDYAFTLMNYSMFLCDQKRWAEAADSSRRILSLRGRTLTDEQPVVAASLQTLGRCLDQLGQPAEAEKALLESLELRRKALGPDHWLVASAMGVLAEHHIRRHRYVQAEPLLLAAERTLEQTVGPSTPPTLKNIGRLVNLYEAWGRPAEAARWKAKLPPSGGR